MGSCPQPAKGREVPEGTGQEPSEEPPSASFFRQEELEIGLDRIPRCDKDRSKMRKLLFFEDLLHRPSVLKKTSEVLHRAVVVGVEDNGIRHVDRLVPRLEKPPGPILVFGK